MMLKTFVSTLFTKNHNQKNKIFPIQDDDDDDDDDDEDRTKLVKT